MNKKLLILFLITPLLNYQLVADTKNSSPKSKPQARIFHHKDSHRKIKGTPRKKSYNNNANTLSEEDFKSSMFSRQPKSAESHGEKNLSLPTHLRKKKDTSVVTPVEKSSQETLSAPTPAKSDSSTSKPSSNTSQPAAKTFTPRAASKPVGASKNPNKANNKGGSHE